MIVKIGGKDVDLPEDLIGPVIESWINAHRQAAEIARLNLKSSIKYKKERDAARAKLKKLRAEVAYYGRGGGERRGTDAGRD